MYCTHEPLHEETDARGITYRLYLEQDDIPVRGNVSASGDEEEDRQIEEDVMERLDRGDTWAWGSVTCQASIDEFSGYDYLGACCYEDTEDFLRGGYWEDMKESAKEELLSGIRSAGEAYRKLTSLRAYKGDKSK